MVRADSEGKYTPASRSARLRSTKAMRSRSMPMASTRPKSDSVLREKPVASMTANVPTIATGTAPLATSNKATGMA